MAVKPQTSYPIFAGVFTIVSASILIVLAVYLMFLRFGFPYPNQTAFLMYYLASDAVNLATDAIGLVGGIMLLMRRHYILAVVGVTVVLLHSISYAQYAVFQLVVSQSLDFVAILYFLGCAAALALSISAAVFTVKSKTEFS